MSNYRISMDSSVKFLKMVIDLNEKSLKREKKDRLFINGTAISIYLLEIFLVKDVTPLNMICISFMVCSQYYYLISSSKRISSYETETEIAKSIIKVKEEVNFNDEFDN